MRGKMLTIFSILLLSFQGYSQVSITGPSCVVANLEYQYKISGDWDSASLMKVCISGGKIISGAINCGEGKPTSLIKVSWHDAQGSLTLTTSKGNASLNVSLTQPLEGGTLDASLRHQSLDSVGLPNTLQVSAASGGACHPSYAYQWQQSPDNLSWSDMPQKTGAQLSFTQRPASTTYYRRKVLESTANTIAYSDIAAVIVPQNSRQP